MSHELLSQIITASGDGSSSSPQFLGLLFLLSGFIFYWAVHRRYRNTDKRHLHESETEAKMLDVRGTDQQVDIRKGLKNSKMEGANNHEVRGSTRGTSGLSSFVLGSVSKNLPGDWKL